MKVMELVVVLCYLTVLCGVSLLLFSINVFKLECETSTSANVNYTRIRFWNQHVLDKKGIIPAQGNSSSV